MTEKEMIAREFSDAELRKIPPEGSDDPNAREGPNPFAKATNHPVGLKNAKAWIRVRGWDDGQDESDIDDPFDAMEHTLAVKRSGFHRAEGPVGLALFPQTAKDVDAWERSCLTMHESQQVITLDDKPTDKNYRPSRLVSALDGKSEPPKFEDYVRMKRGD